MEPTTVEIIQSNIISNIENPHTYPHDTRLKSRRQADPQQQNKIVHQSNIFPNTRQTCKKVQKIVQIQPTKKYEATQIDQKKLNQGLIQNKFYMGTVPYSPKQDSKSFKLLINNNNGQNEKQITEKLKKEGLHVVKICIPHQPITNRLNFRDKGSIEVRYNGSSSNEQNIKISIGRMGIKTLDPTTNHHLNSTKDQEKWLKQKLQYNKVGFLSNRNNSKKQSSTEKFDPNTSYYKLHAKGKDERSKSNSQTQTQSQSIRSTSFLKY